MVFQLSYERLGSDLQETMVSGKRFGYEIQIRIQTWLYHLHCAFLKALYCSQEKRVQKSSDMHFFLQNVPNEIFKTFRMFENNMKFTRAACWINSKIGNWDKSTTVIIFLFCHYCWSLLWCIYWKSLKSDSHLPETLLYLFQ